MLISQHGAIFEKGCMQDFHFELFPGVVQACSVVMYYNTSAPSFRCTVQMQMEAKCNASLFKAFTIE